MGLKETTNSIKEILTKLYADIEKADKGNKAASQRVRTGTVKLEKIAKLYRRESILFERGQKKNKVVKKPMKKAAPAAAAAPAKAAKGAPAKPKAKPKGK